MNVSSDFKQDAARAYPIDRSPRAQQFVHKLKLSPAGIVGFASFAMHFVKYFR